MALMVVCFVLDGKRVLLGEMQRGPFAGYTNAHGGKFDPERDKTILDTVYFEVLEETGLAIERSSVALLGVMDFSFTFKDTVHRVYMFRATAFSGALTTHTPEMVNAWHDTQHMPYERMMPGDRFWMPHALSGEHFIGTCQYSKDEHGKYVVERKHIKHASPEELQVMLASELTHQRT